jgi:hypothetical protein
VRKLELSTVTAITIDGLELTQEKRSTFLKIVEYMRSRINFASIKMLMVDDPNIEGVEFIKIDPIPTYSDWNQFCLSEMHKYVDTDFCLIFHDDGFVVNPEMWRPFFLDYDYIGAPWPPLHPWPEPTRPDRRVGNGGFCLRSKRLLEAVKDFKADQNEDIVIVCSRRDELESAGLRFAPVNVAIDFSIETQFLHEQTMQRSFGFHGKYRVDEALRIISAKSDQN